MARTRAIMVPNILGRGTGRSLRLPALFVCVTGLLLAALAALAWRQIDVERRVASATREAQAASAADALIDEAERHFAQWERLISGAAIASPTLVRDDASLLYFDDTGVRRAAGVPLPFYPAVPAATEVVNRTIDAAEILEFSGRDLAAAESMYRSLSTSGDRRLRAASLARLARVLRAQRKMKPALAAYEALAALDDVPLSGIPAELVAYRARSAIFDQTDDPAEGARERARLGEALWNGGHHLDRASFEALRTVAIFPRDERRLGLANAAVAFWNDWQTESSGRRVRIVDGQPWLSTWHPVAGGRGALVAPAAPLEASLAARAASLGVDITLVAPEGRVDARTAGTMAPIARSARETGLPWTVHVRPIDDGQAGLGARSFALVAGFGLMTLVIAASGFFVFRAVNREVRVAQLQSDFVSAVSHEFRSPLTAMGHLTELLEDGDTAPARLPEYYRALGRETRRLNDLVEGLLDFGRTEAGARTYTMTPVDLVAIVRDVVDGIAAADAAAAARIVVDAPEPPIVVTADAQAIAVVVRNLVDNALKYSPADSPVRVVVSADRSHATLTVEDQGHGLSSREQREVFHKFARGAAAREHGVKGTGIGLTMVQHIVRAHGGTVAIDSAPGRGSRFTVVLRAQE